MTPVGVQEFAFSDSSEGYESNDFDGLSSVE